MSRRAVAALWVLALALAAGACHRDDPETQVRRTMAEMVEAIEAGEVGTFVRNVSGDYTDNESNDAASLRALLVSLTRRTGDVRVTYRVDHVEVRSEREVRTDVFAGYSDGPILRADTRADVAWISARWVLEDGRWKVRRAEIRPGTVVELLGI